MGLGGVTAQNRMAGRLLRRAGYEVQFAWRASYKEWPALSVPLWRLGRARPGVVEDDLEGFRTTQVGTWLPEFEWAHHQAWGAWNRLIDAFAQHIVISGNFLPAWGLFKRGLPSFNWIATPYWPDRADRVKAWPLWRRIHDRLFNSPITLAQERRLIRCVDSWTISDYTTRALQALAPDNRVRGKVIIPVDIERFHPGGRLPQSNDRTVRLCFSGRVSDPRKGMPLLLAAFAKVAAQRPAVELAIFGDLTLEALRQRYDVAAIADRLSVQPAVANEALPDMLRQADIFVLPSYQEGLSQIAGEAMASGCCVVSTRCGGPEEFVLDGETGLLADLDADSLADALLRAIDDADLRRRLAENGVALIRERYTPALFERQFMAAFATVYPSV